MSTDKTLADVQPGGRVRLGDQAERARFEKWMTDVAKIIVGSSDPYPAGLERDYWRVWQAALSAQPSPATCKEGLQVQPSPGGQEWSVSDEMVSTASRAYHAASEVGSRNCMRSALEAAIDTLAARQPVGELVFRERPTHNAYRGSFSGPCRCWADADHAVGNEVMRYAAPPAQVVDLAPDHRGMRVSYSGLLNQVRGGLNSNPELAEMVRQLHGHLNELGKRWYAGDRKVVDEFLQLYVIEDGARRALIDSQAVGK
ncbi:TPA: hypothetical protein ACOFCN_000307 [Stenotrophomonas maltophilia]